MNTHKPRTKQEAHEEAQADNLDEKYTISEQLTLIVDKSPSDNNGREASARHGDVAVFITPGRLSLTSGTTVRVQVSYIGDTYLKARAIATLD